MNCNARDMLNAAYSYGYAKLCERDLMAAAVAAACAMANGGGASQIVPYTGANPNADGVKPANTALAAIAVKPTGTLYVWNVATQVWQ
jgi:hypothetical protein